MPELSDNSSSSCSDRKILNINPQVSEEYLNEAFRILPTTIHLRHFMQSQEFKQSIPARGSLDSLRMLFDDLTHSILYEDIGAPKLIELTEYLGLSPSVNTGDDRADRAASDSITRNMSRVRHLQMRIVLMDRYWDDGAQPEGIIHALSGVVCARIPRRNSLSPDQLLFRNLTHLTIDVTIRTSSSQTLISDSGSIQRIDDTVAQDVALLWTNGTLVACRISIRHFVKKEEKALLYQSTENRIRDQSTVITEQILGGVKKNWEWSLGPECGRTLKCTY
jgi:hypothetical protein